MSWKIAYAFRVLEKWRCRWLKNPTLINVTQRYDRNWVPYSQSKYPESTPNPLRTNGWTASGVSKRRSLDSERTKDGMSCQRHISAPCVGGLRATQGSQVCPPLLENNNNNNNNNDGFPYLTSRNSLGHREGQMIWRMEVLSKTVI